MALVGEGSAWMDPETVVSGNTLEELCEAAGIPVADGVASIERYNELCAKGCDDDFGVAGSDMAAIDTPPFFCIKGDVGMSGINAGVMVDNRYRVIDTEGAPIPGLYAAGIQAGNPAAASTGACRRFLELAHLHRRALHGHPRADRRHDARPPGELRGPRRLLRR